MIKKDALVTLFTLSRRIETESLEVLTAKLIKSLSELVLSKNEDTSWITKIEYSGFTDDSFSPNVTEYNLMLKSKNASLGTVLNFAESSKYKNIPANLSRAEIKAAQRMITMIFLSMGARHLFATEESISYGSNEELNRSSFEFAQRLLEGALLTNFTNLDVYSDALMRAFLNFGSETPDNMRCAQYLEYGIVDRQGGHKVAGFKIVNKPILLSQILEWISTLPMPFQVKKKYPQLTLEDWKLVTKMVNLILRSLENENAS